MSPAAEGQSASTGIGAESAVGLLLAAAPFALKNLLKQYQDRFRVRGSFQERKLLWISQAPSP